MSAIIYWFCFVLQGVLLVSMGFSALTWQYWAVLVNTGVIALALNYK
jgi:hypothetical protein